MKGYKLLRRDRPRRHCGEVALSVRQNLESTELCLGVDDEQVESLWVRIKGQMSESVCSVGVCSRLPDWSPSTGNYRSLKVI